MNVFQQLVHNEDHIIAQATEVMISELPNSSDDLLALHDWRMLNGHDPYNGPEPEADDWQNHLAKWCEDRIDAAMWNIAYQFKGDQIRVYRDITAPENWKPDPSRHPGIYWSWDADAADAHWGDFTNGDVQWRMTAVVKADEIDWVRTLVQNAMPSYEHEREIRLREDQPVKIIDVTRING